MIFAANDLPKLRMGEFQPPTLFALKGSVTSLMDYGYNVTADVGANTISSRNESTTTSFIAATEESAKAMRSESSREPLSAINTGTSKNITVIF